MTENTFIQKVMEVLRERFSPEEYEIHEDVFTKNNDTRRHGIVMKKKGEIISPTIYVDSYYKDYLDKKMTIPEIAEQISGVWQRIREHASQYNSLTLDFEFCREKVIYRLVSRERNSQLLQKIPYIPFLNLAITFQLVCNISEQGIETLRISNELMDKWGVSTRTLVTLAEKNTPRLFPPKVDSLTNLLLQYFELAEHFLPEQEGAPDPTASMLILSNECSINGATTLLYPDMIHNLAEKYQKNLYILPSSIHELILIPDDNAESLSELTKLVRDINQRHVQKEEVLSDTAYYYDRNEKRFLF
ncbi:MAG: hypothetical protein J1F02_03825 [Lachnospiraceae bacterium]|nr:hypothetical protein [Lachnospiraceae bacterium]